MSDNLNVRRGFMCATDFYHEIGEAWGGSTIYSSLRDIKSHQSCWKQCGIVEVKITMERVVVKENFKDMSDKSTAK